MSDPMNTTSVYSSLAADPNLGELVEMILRVVPERGIDPC
jgi:hypothetical protein